RFMVYPSGFAGTNQATAAGWQVDDIESVVAGLTANGVVFQEYDFDELKTVDGIATLPNGIKGAWFTDSEGNILSLFQMA
ncbi:MAG: VOC family protein, partial [Acidimicrobiia bacterium]|nr:VOC family protein [Acidimicrobiia bacterium]NNF87481.1 VOC family protein [Acidimicrobiia bacterium]